MIYSTPPITGFIAGQLNELDQLREDLSIRVGRAVPWVGALRRFEKGAVYGSSVGIEGFSIEQQRATELASGTGDAPATDDERALACYTQAMDHVATLATDNQFGWSKRVILDLHFETCRFQRDKRPGLFRNGPMRVTGPRGDTAYQAPPPEHVAPLCEELVSGLESAGETHVVVLAAMAHLNLVSIHPFEDGNGRISRIIQSLVLSRQGILVPELGSIESFLAEDTNAYYDHLREVQRGSYSPQNDASPWVEFCVQAHMSQALDRKKKVDSAAERWGRLEEIAASRGWDDRLLIALEQALSGGTNRARYAEEAGIANPTASNDLRRLVDAGYLDRVSQGRTTSYEKTEHLERATR